MRASAFDPPAIAAEFWARPSVAQALARRDMGALFRLLSQYEGLSQTRIATATGIAQGRVSEIVRGKRAVGASHVFERIADGLEMPDLGRLALGLAPLAASSPPSRARSSRSPAGRETDLLRQISAARNIDASVVTALQNETETIRRLDRRLGAPAVAVKLEAHISQVETGLRYSLRPSNRQQLAAVLADASALAGWQAIDMGRLPQAWDHFERVTGAAREAGDTCLLAFAGGEQAYVLLDLGRPHEALQMVRAAYDETHDAIPHQIRGWLRAAEGEMAAAAGDEVICRTALDQAAAEVSRGPSSSDLPYLALNETHLARWRGNCLVHFGDPQTADELAHALHGLDGSFTRAEAGLRCDLAAALHVRGERREARQHLARAHELAQATGSTRQRRRIRCLAKQIGSAS
jgi:transcriptional regulator with XRE-family HTH domain